MPDILPLAKQLLNELQLHHYHIRLMGLTVSNPIHEETGKADQVPIQLSLDF